MFGLFEEDVVIVPLQLVLDRGKALAQERMQFLEVVAGDDMAPQACGAARQTVRVAVSSVGQWKRSICVIRRVGTRRQLVRETDCDG